MTTKTHFETGLATAFGLAGLYFTTKIGNSYSELDHNTLMALLNVVMIWVGVTAGAIYPDISIQNSEVANGMNWEVFFGKRGITHTLVNVVGLGIWFLPAILISHFGNVDMTWLLFLVGSIMIGCVQHMALDSLTPQGIAWLYPLTDKHFNIPLVRGAKSEKLFRIVYFAIMIPIAVHWNMI